ncbi:AraC-like DNA-binding protein [Haloferula luteola]|uniref:AraC-like DNA-binding protein n=1 Tax=Haloferula luteola TaxID=595692 RepID=A0A840V2R6_9BACT|nr:AraC family transcriptional regulator [Haloferula luteola]MBB5349954.1 AraC-like DNA-binding protein [Haloferula luteola]
MAHHPLEPFTDCTHLGVSTKHDGLRSPKTGPSREPWLEALPVCPLLDDFGIRHLGIVHATAGYRFERTNPACPLLIASVYGAGWLRVSETILLLESGEGALTPKGRPQSYSVEGDGLWCFAWICFDELAPFSIGCDGRWFRHEPVVFHKMVEALVRCWESYQEVGMAGKLLEALMGLVRLRANLDPELERFHAGWERIGSRLHLPWTLSSLAGAHGYSIERFRLICQREFQMAPIQHLSRLRMREAKRLLAEARLTIDEVAVTVGYSDANAFSHAFKRSFGHSPRSFRDLS